MVIISCLLYRVANIVPVRAIGLKVLLMDPDPVGDLGL